MNKDKAVRVFLGIPGIRSVVFAYLSIFLLKNTWQKTLKNLFLTNKRKNIEGFQYLKGVQKFDWLIRICAPSGEQSKFWGDTYFANELSTALIELGHTAKVLYRDEDPELSLKPNSILLNIRGLFPLPTSTKAINLVWIISHPKQISKNELNNYHGVFAASEGWARRMSKKFGIKIIPLLQATNPKVFNTSSQLERKNEILFVGNTRGQFRKSVKIANESINNLKVIGLGWEKYLPQEKIKQNFIENNKLSKEYRNAAFVLCDQWEDMTKEGFISNRLFDAVSSGARVITEHIESIDKVFPNSLLSFKTESELKNLLESDLNSKFQSQDLLDASAASVQNTHSFKKRAETLVNFVNNLVN